MPKRLLTLTTLLALAACALPLSAPVIDQDQPAVVAVEATVPPPAATHAAPAPATLETALVVSVWDEAAGASALWPVDPLTGSALEGYAPLPLGESFSAVRSPDGRRLAALSYSQHVCDAWAGGTRCQPSQGVLHFIDLAAWADTPTTVQAEANASLMVFSPDGGLLAIGQSAWPQHSLLLVDTTSGALLAHTPLDFAPSQAAFSADGAHLYVYGRHYTESNGFNPQPRAALLAAPDLAVLWQPDLPGLQDGQYVPPQAHNAHDESVWWLPGVAFAPEAARLYVVHADLGALTTIDFAAQTVTSVEIGPARSWLDRLMALTAGVAEAKILNGFQAQALLAGSGADQRLYVVGAEISTHDGYTRTPLGLRVIDPATGVELAQQATSATQLSLVPNGRQLLLTDWEARARTQVLNRASLAVEAELADLEVIFTRLANGQPAALGLHAAPDAVEVRWLDPATLTELGQWAGSAYLWPAP